MFSHLPDSLFKANLAPSATPIAMATVTGPTVSAEVIQNLVARLCPVQAAWRWEAISHEEKSFLINFPSMADLGSVDDFELRVPNSQSRVTFKAWIRRR